MPAPTATERLIESAFELREECAALDAKIAGVEGAIILLGKGRHSGTQDGHTVTVLDPIPAGIKLMHLAGDDIETAKGICGDAFTRLFEKEVTYKPESGFADRLEMALPAAARRKLLELVQKETPAKRASIRYPSAAKA